MSVEDFSFKSESEWYKDGALYYNPSKISTSYIESFRNESSVNTGSFVPGNYRVNPYSVQSGYPLGEATSVSRTFSESIQGHDYFYLNTISGFHQQLAVYGACKDMSRVASNTEGYEQITLQKAMGKVLAADLALGEDLGEYRETIQMIRHPLKQLRQFLLDDRARNFSLLLALKAKDKFKVNRLLGRTGKASADSMSGTWMELRYGLRPLVYLVQDIIDKIQKSRRKAYDPEKIRSAKSRLQFPRSTTMVRATNGGDSDGVLWTADVMAEERVNVNASIQYKQKYEQSLLDDLGLTPRHLPETVWALTRLSFVVDWIFSIGPWLATLRINPGIEILGNTVGVKTEKRYYLDNMKARHPWADASSASTVATSGTDVGYAYDTYVRKCHVHMDNLPHFTFGRTLDLYKLVDSLAIIWQFAGQKRWRK